MIVDCHTHIGKQHVVGTVDNLLKSMDSAKIDKSLVFAGMLNGISNQELLASISPYSDRLMGVASISLNNLGGSDWSTNEFLDLLDTMKDVQICALKLYLGYEHHYANSEAVYKILAMFKTYEIDKPIIFHCGDCVNTVSCAKVKYSHPLHVDDVAVDFPNQKFVMAHMGYPWHRDAAQVCYKNKNVFADVSGFVYGEFSEKDERDFQKVIDEFVFIAGNTDKLIFGSDFPISNQSSYLRVLEKMEMNIYSNYTKVFAV